MFNVKECGRPTSGSMPTGSAFVVAGYQESIRRLYAWTQYITLECLYPRTRMYGLITQLYLLETSEPQILCAECMCVCV